MQNLKHHNKLKINKYKGKSTEIVIDSEVNYSLVEAGVFQIWVFRQFTAHCIVECSSPTDLKLSFMAILHI